MSKVKVTSPDGYLAEVEADDAEIVELMCREHHTHKDIRRRLPMIAELERQGFKRYYAIQLVTLACHKLRDEAKRKIS